MSLQHVFSRRELFCVRLAAELGDYNPEEHKDNYLSEFRFTPGQTQAFEDEVAAQHRTHKYVASGEGHGNGSLLGPREGGQRACGTKRARVWGRLGIV